MYIYRVKALVKRAVAGHAMSKKRSYVRSMFLGVFATLSLGYFAHDSFGVPYSELLGLLGWSVVLLGVAVVPALLGALILSFWRRR